MEKELNIQNKKLNELKDEIKKQEDENIRLFNIFQYKLHEEIMQPIIKQWREGSKKLKELLEEFCKLEKEVRESLPNTAPKETKTFVNSFGEATKRYITTQTFEKTNKRNQKRIESFLGCK